MRSVDPDGDIVHAGTFFGDFLPALARTRKDGARIWAFEPSRENHRCAEITVLLNDLTNVSLMSAALGAEPGTAILATSNRAGVPSGGASRLVHDAVAGRSEEAVDVVRLDDVIGDDRRVALVQLDVEGFEQSALEGAMNTIRRCRPLLVLESFPAVWFNEHLEPLGYVATGWVDANRVLRCASGESSA
jgi:FkbM family methyltransferase